MLFCKGLSEARLLCNYRTAWDFHLSALLCSTAQSLGFRQLTKDNAMPSFLLDYAVDSMIIHVCRQGWKEGERADFSVTQQACGECHLGFGKRHHPNSIPGCISESHCSDVVLKASAFCVCAFLPTPSHVVSFLEAGNPVCICLVPGGLVIFSE